jgi:phytoene dehydrogenase-like protein
MITINDGTYDVIIIGAGISGLICGCYLAKAGMKVLIIEQHDKPGGYFTSFKRKNFQFDAAAHSFGNYREGGHVRKIFTEVGVSDIIKIQRYDPSDIIITPDFKLTFGRDTQATIDHLSDIFPDEKNHIIDFINFLTSENQIEIIKLKDKTFSSLLHSFFTDERLISSFSAPVFGNGGLPPSQMHAFSGAKIFSEFIIDGGYYPEGGIQNLPNALDQVIKTNHGKTLYKRSVKKIIVENNEIVGVELDNKETLRSKYVVSACDVTQTFDKLLGREVCGSKIMNSLKKLIPSMSNFILYIGLDEPFEGLPHPGTNMWFLPHYNLDDMFSSIQKCDLGNAGMYMLRVSPDQRTVLAFVGAPFMSHAFWKHNKEKMANEFLTKIEKDVPNIRKHVTYFDAATPSTLYRYTLNSAGASFGWAKLTSQTFDPIMSKTTFIKGLYLTGHWTSIAFGMPGACYAGDDTAKRILRKENLK